MSGTVYFKATRPDGTDFRTGTIKYTVGKRVRPAPYLGERRICGPGLLHAADVPAMTLVGGSWPCRLFEVTGRPVAGFDDDGHKHKGGFKQLTVLREIDPYPALGPNGRYVAGIIERMRQLDRDQLRRLDAVWAVTWHTAARSVAFLAARTAARSVAWFAADRHAATAAGSAAARALVVRDLISPEQFELLYGPWRSVLGDPEELLQFARVTR